jgi:hypothetical protein
MALSEKTLIPIGVAIIVIGGGAGWLTKISVDSSAHGKMIEAVQAEHKEDQNELKDVLKSIDRRLYNIEFKLKIAPNQENANGD